MRKPPSVPHAKQPLSWLKDSERSSSVRFAEPNGAEALIPLDSTRLPPPVVVVEIPPVILPFAFSAAAPPRFFFSFLLFADYSPVRFLNDKNSRLFLHMSENR